MQKENLNKDSIFTCDNSWPMSDILSACVAQAQLLLLIPFSSATTGKLVRKENHKIKGLYTSFLFSM